MLGFSELDFVNRPSLSLEVQAVQKDYTKNS